MEEKNFDYLPIDDAQYKTILTEKFKKRKPWTAPDPKKIVSFIPGTVLKVFVKEGKKVSKGDVLFILEAMKMQNKVESPFDGKIKLVNISPKQTVAKGHLMIEFA